MQLLSPFNAYIVLVTISGRCLAHQQQCTVDGAYGNMSQDFLTRHQWLESLLADKTRIILANTAGNADDEPADPMVLFTHMTAQATTLILGKAMQSVPWNYQDGTSAYDERVVEAAQQVSHLVERLAEFGYSKVSLQ